MKKLGILFFVAMLVTACATGQSVKQTNSRVAFQPLIAASVDQPAQEAQKPVFNNVKVRAQIENMHKSVYTRHADHMARATHAAKGSENLQLNSRVKLLANAEFMSSRHDLEYGLDERVKNKVKELASKNMDTVGWGEGGNRKTTISTADRIRAEALYHGAVNPEFMKSRWDLKNGKSTYSRWVYRRGHNGPASHLLNCVDECK